MRNFIGPSNKNQILEVSTEVTNWDCGLSVCDAAYFNRLSMHVESRYPWYKSAVNVTYPLSRKENSFVETLVITQETTRISLKG
jgi:hypothetical protein